MTEFGRTVWWFAAKRGITTQRELARVLSEACGYRVSHETVRNYLNGRTSVPTRFLRQLDIGLHLTDAERVQLGHVFAWGETKRKVA